MANYWNQHSIPHKGWTLLDVIDIREDGASEDETDYESCMMCGNEKIRYVHIVTHNEVDEDFRVGCICAQKMTNDYINPEKREKDLKNKNLRRINWAKKKWKVSVKGNDYLNKDGHFLSIFKNYKSGKYKCLIDKKFGSKEYDSTSLAKIGLFNKIEEMKVKGLW